MIETYVSHYINAFYNLNFKQRETVTLITSVLKIKELRLWKLRDLLYDLNHLGLTSMPVWLRNSGFNHVARWPWFAQKCLDGYVKTFADTWGQLKVEVSIHTPGVVTKCSRVSHPSNVDRPEREGPCLFQSPSFRLGNRMLGPQRPWVSPGMGALCVSSELAFWNILLFLGPPLVIVPSVRVTRQVTH